MSARSVGVAEVAPAADQVFPIRTVWVAGIATLATAVVGAGLGLTSKPGFLALAGAGGLVFLALALAAPRAAFVAVVFALAGYLPDTLLHSGLVSQGLLVAVLAAVLIRRAVRIESLPTPRVLWGFGALVAALVISTLPVADLSPAFSKIVDLAGFTVLVVLTVMLVDSERWLYRAMWAVAGAVGLLALLAVAQRELNLPDVAFGGLATMMRDAGIERSGGPLSSNFFGQVVAATAILAVYLGLTARSFVARAAAVTVFAACALALVDTGSRGAFIAFALTVFLVGVLRGVRFPVLLAFVLVSLVVGNALAPPAVKARVTSLATLATGQIPEDSSFSGRLSENLAALDMWRSHPLIGVGPGNFESEYLSYSPAINLDQRAEVRSAHDLYLESLAETGIVGAVPFFSLLAFALIEAWKGRRGKRDRLSLLSEGAFVALVSFLITAVTLHAGYPRYLWMFVGLALAAGRVRRTSVAT